MKVSLDGIDKAEGITSQVKGPNPEQHPDAATTKLVGGATAGLKYEVVKDLDGTVQLDKLNDTTAVVIRMMGKTMSLETVPLP